ncbi:MAG: adenylate kinase [Ignavibacteria bacterium]
MNLGKKIVIVGSSGSGKTTFAGRLSQLTKIKQYEIDSMFWKPNWVQTGDEEFRGLVGDVTCRDEWIIDGNYRRVQDLTVGRANTVIWLDMNLPRIMYRVTLRTAGRLVSKKPLWHNNRESLKTTFSKDSIILYSLNNYRSKKRWYNRLINNEELKHVEWLIIKNQKEERKFWDTLKEMK